MEARYHVLKNINEAYYLALLDISEGASIKELEEAIKLYEFHEEYETCAGILKAIKEAEHLTLKEIDIIIQDYGIEND
tara:strand:+ start:2924 stop:3157 length:234 start_codon:yes stop_codon:yes gene_type:complete